MPELKEVNAWNEVGTRRSLDDLGRAAISRGAFNYADWGKPMDDGW